MVNVLKANGIAEPFDENKLRTSMTRTGISQSQQDKVILNLKPSLHENIPTAEIYEHVTRSLQEQSHLVKLRYSLKQAIMELGPTGYPFEDFVSEILKSKGYLTQVRSILTGRCVNHEIDVIAEKAGTEKLMIEAKYHNAPGIHTDVHVSLYTKARFDDLKEKYHFDRAWLFTNTRITSDALAYALCVNMGVVSWNYPQNESLRDLTEKEKLYPVTILSSLSQNQKQVLLENHTVSIKQILNNNDCLDLLAIEKVKKEQIIEESKNFLS
jgi:hypothetical protein